MVIFSKKCRSHSGHLKPSSERRKTMMEEKEKVSVTIIVKKKKEIEVAGLLEMFQSQLSTFKRHCFNIKRQFSHYCSFFLRTTLASLQQKSKQCTKSKQHYTQEFFMLVGQKSTCAFAQFLLQNKRALMPSGHICLQSWTM